MTKERRDAIMNDPEVVSATREYMEWQEPIEMKAAEYIELTARHLRALDAILLATERHP